jgi:hypothetical protein
MFGSPKDVEGECNAWLFIGDDYGDNHATMRCQLPKDHDGPHKEVYKRKGTDVTVTWEGDDGYICPTHGHVEEGIMRKEGYPCDHCFDELPDCPSCKGTGYNQVGDQHIDCTACDGHGKVIK